MTTQRLHKLAIAAETKSLKWLEKACNLQANSKASDAAYEAYDLATIAESSAWRKFWKAEQADLSKVKK